MNTIYQMDCLVGLPLLPACSVDMVLCDLPYGTTQNKWDSVLPLPLLWEQYQRVLKPNGVVALTAQIPFSITLGMSNLSWLRYEWVWEKPNATGFLNAKTYPLKAHENVLIFCEGTHRYYPQMLPGKPYVMSERNSGSNNYGKMTRISKIENDGVRYPRTVLTFPHDKPSIHPTQKPVALFEYLIRTYTTPGDLVLDNCMGSGTTAIACLNSDRRYVGYEIDPGYWKVAMDRIAAYQVVKEEIEERSLERLFE